MADYVECIVIGAGVVGLACARRLAAAGREVLVLERHELIGSETSSRNSEVIHAGIYYPTGSLKAKLCVAGKHQLYDYCDEHQVPYSRCGKIIVATHADQRATLEAYQRQAEENGVVDLTWLSQSQVRAFEPAVVAVAGLLSPSTGIIDSHAYMLSLQGELEQHGGVIAFNTSVSEVTSIGNARLAVTTLEMQLETSCVVNSAGLSAPDLIRSLVPQAPAAHYARGRYYAYSGKPPFSRLVYPVAETGGLGVHVTLDLAGQIKFGPDVEWIDGVNYEFDESRRDEFVTAIRRYYPEIQAERLHSSYVGIRPKISGRDEKAADFRIDSREAHGVSGLINLFGIESPGLTASLAIADVVMEHLSTVMEQVSK